MHWFFPCSIRWCKRPVVCGNEVIQETAYCYTEGSYCERWIQKQIEYNQAEDNEGDKE